VGVTDSCISRDRISQVPFCLPATIYFRIASAEDIANKSSIAVDAIAVVVFALATIGGTLHQYGKAVHRWRKGANAVNRHCALMAGSII
jgi:hypothetical protein